MSNTWFKREENTKVIIRMGENETEIDFVLVKKEHRRFIQNVNEITVELLVVADIDRKIIRNVLKKTCADRKKVSLPKDRIRKLFVEEVIN